VDQALATARDMGVPASVIGTVGGDRFVIEVEGDQQVAGCRIDVDLETLYDKWANSLERALEL
jgi:phosphoribosylformylglycinamidine synthase